MPSTQSAKFQEDKTLANDNSPSPTPPPSESSLGLGGGKRSQSPSPEIPFEPNVSILGDLIKSPLTTKPAPDLMGITDS